MALAGPPDDDDHVGIEVNEEAHGQNEEEDKGELVYRPPLELILL